MEENRYSEDGQVNTDEPLDLNSEEEVPEVKMSVKKTMWVLVGFMVFVICILLIMRSVSVARKTGSPRTSGKAQTEAQVNDRVPISSSGSSDRNVSENKSNLDTTDSSLDSGSNSVKKETKVENAVSTREPVSEESSITSETSTPSEFKEQPSQDIQLSDRVDSNGLISAKKIYKFDDSYIYGIEILVLDEGEEATCQYFCPYKTYSSVNVGDTIKVSYQKDVEGYISVYSIG